MAGYTLTSINKLRLTNEDRESWYADYIRNMNIIDGKLLSANAVTNSMLAADAVEDENVAAGAAIQRSKLASGSADHVVINNASGVMISEATLAKVRGGTGADNSSVTFPSTGVIVTRDATETLTNKTIDGDDNILQDISISSLKTVLADANKVILRDASGVVSSALLANVNVSASAAIAYSKLNLSGSILNADINASAGIERSKLASGTASHVIINDGSGVLSSEARLSLDRTIDGTDNYVLVANGSGVNPGYALLLDNNIDASAAIARTKVANGTADHVIINNGSGTLSSEAQLSVSRGGTGLSALGTSNQVLGVNNAGNAAEYKTISAGTSGTDFAVAHSANTVTLNLPTASALNRGALSTSDWSTFNSKIGGSGTNGQIALFSGSGTITSDASIAYTTGSNANNISLTSGLKLGTNTTAAATAGSGSLRYNAGVVEYSDGVNWNTFGVTGAGILTLNSLGATAQSFANDTNVTITSVTATHTLGWSGQLSIARGGTGLSALGTSNQVLGVDNAGNVAEYKTLSVGTSGTDFAIVNAANAITFNLPTASAANRGALSSSDWSTFNAKVGGSGTNGQIAVFNGTGTVTSALGTSNQILGVDNGATAAEYKTLSVGTSGTDFAIAHSAGGVAFNLPDAGASARGAVTTGTQTFAGVKTFSSAPIVTGLNIAATSFVVNSAATNSGSDWTATIQTPATGMTASPTHTLPEISGTLASFDATNRNGIGLVPVGAIIPYFPGSFGAGANTTYTNRVGAGNTVAQINALLNSVGWYVCNGASLNDASSPIFNGAGRFLPDLTDDRFIQGATTAGTAGGANTFTPTGTISGITINAFTISSSNLPTHTHTIDHDHGSQTTGAGSAHSHGVNQWSHAHLITAPDYGGYIQSTGSGGLGAVVFRDGVGDSNSANPSNWLTNTVTSSASIQNESSHTHTFDVANFTGNSGNGGFANSSITPTISSNGSFSGSATNQRPKYLNVYYIMRIK